MENIESRTKNYQINGTSLHLKEKIKVIDALRDEGIDIPSICYKPAAPGEGSCAPGSCRICQVEINGQIATACEHYVLPDMRIRTDTSQVRQAQQFTLGLICEEHHGLCLDCPANTNCKLRDLAGQLEPWQSEIAWTTKQNGNNGAKRDYLLDFHAFDHERSFSTPSIEFDSGLCINCGLCAAVCPTGAIGSISRGVNRHIGPAPNVNFEASCVYCGQCTKACPTGALVEKCNIADVEKALEDPGKWVIFQIAPAVRVALGEAFGLPPGQLVTGKIYAALRRLGVVLNPQHMIDLNDHHGMLRLNSNVLVTDTNVAADLTIMEEATEIVGRIEKGEPLPVITSCCPGWIKYMETYYPELSKYACTAKSPQQIMGALTKTYGAEVWGIDPADMVNVSIMPCTAKKFEAQRPEMNASGYRDVDFVITTRELVRMFKSRGLNLAEFEEEKADYPFEEYTGAATLFGTTGGVMEAVVRTIQYLVTGKEFEGIDVLPAKGMKSLKEANIELDDLKLRIAILHNLKDEHLSKVLDEVLDENNEQNYAAIEVMACPGGCIGGGGQPKEFDNWEVKLKRTAGLTRDDHDQRYRRSHESPVIKRIYANYLGRPNSSRAHELCHTNYEDRSVTLIEESMHDIQSSNAPK